MRLSLMVPEEIADSVHEIASRSGQTTDNLLLDALRAHFPPIPEALLAEFNALEQASDEDFRLLEAKLESENNAAG